MSSDLLSAIGVDPNQRASLLDAKELAAPQPVASQGEGKTFGQFLVDALGDVNDLESKAGEMVQQFAQGAPLDVHQVMIATEKASTAVALATQVRNKLVDAYTEIIHTQM